MLTSIRGGDLAVRLGGEEFVLLLQAPLPAAVEVAERIREQISQLRYEPTDISSVTISAGVAARRPGERDWWEATGHPVEIGPDFDPFEIFLHDVPESVRAQAGAHTGPQAARPMTEPWPLDRWPDVPTRFVLSRDDRFFPAQWQRGVVRDRLGIEPDELDGGHCVALSRPKQLAALLESLRTAHAIGPETSQAAVAHVVARCRA